MVAFAGVVTRRFIRQASQTRACSLAGQALEPCCPCNDAKAASATAIFQRIQVVAHITDLTEAFNSNKKSLRPRRERRETPTMTGRVEEASLCHMDGCGLVGGWVTAHADEVGDAGRPRKIP